LISNDIRMRQDLPDAVHQMRVAVRRMRSGLKSLPLLDKKATSGLLDELKWLADELGDYRDAEVMQGRITELEETLDEPSSRIAQDALLPALQMRLESGRHRALDAVRSSRYTDVLEALVRCAADPAFTDSAEAPARDVMPALIQRSLTKLERKVTSLEMNASADTWHAARISAKHARYAVDAVVQVFGAPAKKRSAALAKVTDLLGAMNDCAVTAAFLDEHSRGVTDPALAYALGLLSGHEQEAAQTHRKSFLRLWPDVQRIHRKNELRQ
jgi:CHAD domain-containing protein